MQYYSLTPSTPEQPQSYQHAAVRGFQNEAPWRATMSANSEKRTTMPKNFTQPLTCFYWHTYGYCNKSDDQCLYAHYPTGLVAAAPVSLRDNKGPVAGRNAIFKAHTQFEREKQLHSNEAMLEAKQMERNGKSLNGAASRMQDETERLRKSIVEAQDSTAKAQIVLVASRDTLSRSINTHNSASGDLAVTTINQAMAAMAIFTAELDSVNKRLEELRNGG